MAWAIHDHERCVFHVEGDVRKALREKPLSREEQVVIISRQIKSVQKNVKNSLEKALAIKGLVSLLRDLQGGNLPDDNGKADPLKSKLEKWKHQT